MRHSIIILIYVITLCSCRVSHKHDYAPAVNENTMNIQSNTLDRRADVTANNFAVTLFNKICNIEDKENICISPVSAMYILSMLANGAEGNTLAQITELLETEDIDILNRKQKELIKILTECDTDIRVSLANSIWINEKLHVKTPFITANRELYDATIGKSEFSNTTVSEINKWCCEKTNGKIKTIIEKLDSNTRMLLLNALYFKAGWLKPFNENATTQQPFRKENGDTINVDMMSLKAGSLYLENDTLQIVSKPFSNGKFEMLFILPHKNIKISELPNILVHNLDKWQREMQAENILLGVPKFKTEYGTSLKNTLQMCGITDAFNSNADFSSISDTPLYVDDIIQKSYISIDEYGAEAAAVTMASMQLLSARPTEHKTVILNRPFIFAITESITGNNNILFMGKTGEPKNF